MQSNAISITSAAYTSDKSDFIHDVLQDSYFKPVVRAIAGDDFFAFSNDTLSALTGCGWE